MIVNDKILAEVLNIAFLAGESILDIKDKKININLKNDNSPVTNADKAANEIITKKLELLTPYIEIVSEENKENNLMNKGIFWLIDPLDGTKEFINGSDEYTVNIALIKNHKPQFGLIHAPSKKLTYFTKKNNSYKLNEDNTEKKIRTSTNKLNYKIALMSNSHSNNDTDNYIKNNRIPFTKKIGSSLKFRIIAEGEGDIYPRFGRTMEWDTAAGQAIVESAGGKVEELDGEPLTYGKDNFVNPPFICRS